MLSIYFVSFFLNFKKRRIRLLNLPPVLSSESSPPLLLLLARPVPSSSTFSVCSHSSLITFYWSFQEGGLVSTRSLYLFQLYNRS